MISRGDFYRLVGSVSNLSGRFCSTKNSRPINLFIFMASICLFCFVLFPCSTNHQGLVNARRDWCGIFRTTKLRLLSFFSKTCGTCASILTIWTFFLFAMFRFKTIFFSSWVCAYVCVSFEPPNFDRKCSTWPHFLFFFTLHSVLQGLLRFLCRTFADALGRLRCALLRPARPQSWTYNFSKFFST